MPKSRLLQELERDIAAAKGPAIALKAKRAMLLARQGRLDAARTQLAALHELAFGRRLPELQGWLLLGDALLAYYSDFDAGAGRVSEALSLAQGAELKELGELCLAWSAHFAYVRHDIAALSAAASAARAGIATDHHAAQSRLCLIIGNAHDYANQPKTAQAWYVRAREHAAMEGDEATLSALIYNVADHRIARARRESLAAPQGTRPELLLGADSVAHFDAAVGSSAMGLLTPILRGHALVLQGDYSGALSFFEAQLAPVQSRGLGRWNSSLLAEMAWCLWHCGEAGKARSHAVHAEAELPGADDIDDRAITHARLAQVYAALDEGPQAERHGAMAEQLWREYRADQQRWNDALAAAGLLSP